MWACNLSTKGLKDDYQEDWLYRCRGPTLKDLTTTTSNLFTDGSEKDYLQANKAGLGLTVLTAIDNFIKNTYAAVHGPRQSAQMGGAAAGPSGCTA